MNLPGPVTHRHLVRREAGALACRRWFWVLLFLTACWGVCVGDASAQGIESILAPGKLIQGHAKLENDCRLCHVRFNRNAQDGLCMDCHKDVAQDMRGRTGYHGRLKPQACNTCHTDHKGREARIVELDTKRFDHASTDYALRGKHLKVDCQKCHLPPKKYREAPGDCHACHRGDDVHKGSLGTKCADCHGEANWKEATFDHDKTRFALTGRHVDTKCSACHKDRNLKDTPLDCYGCHRKDDDGVKGHKGQYGEKCETCHDAKAWKPSTFNHDEDTRYGLRGRHRTLKCADCHTGHLYKARLSIACVDCHRKDDKHKETLGRDCGACHTERDWKEKARFDHDKTNFPLLGKHAEAECKTCHRSALYKEAPKDCIGCHRKDDRHEKTLGENCGDCHGERDWKTTQGRFDHARTKFPLRNAHAEPKLKCDACHKDLRSLRKTPLECVACHRKDDKHETTLGEKCGDCHGDRDWKTTQGRFDHDRTHFPLRNAHAAPKLECKSCHKDLRSLRKTPLECSACHRKDDKHEGQLGVQCDKCHGDRSWKVETYDHARTRFPLVGRHLVARCQDCHETPRYKDAKRECDACHAKVDKHERRFGTACETCHNARAWSIWDFDHNRRSRYKLDGAHLKPKCERCHTAPAPAPAGKGYAPVGSTCISCHRTDDVHDGGFGVRCEQCHVTERWKKVSTRVGGAGA